MSRYKSADQNYQEKEKKQQQCHKVSNEPLMLSDAAKNKKIIKKGKICVNLPLQIKLE